MQVLTFFREMLKWLECLRISEHLISSSLLQSAFFTVSDIRRLWPDIPTDTFSNLCYA